MPKSSEKHISDNSVILDQLTILDLQRITRITQLKIHLERKKKQPDDIKLKDKKRSNILRKHM